MQSLFPRDILDEILNLIESVSEGFPTYSYLDNLKSFKICLLLLIAKIQPILSRKDLFSVL